MPLKSRVKRVVGLLIAVIAVISASAYYSVLPNVGKAAPIRTYVNPEIGELAVIISSTGRVSAKSTVTVGSQVSGEISSVNADFNQPVSKGQVVARINPARYEAQLSSANAALAGAAASLQRALERSRQVARDLDRSEDLARRQLIARVDLEHARDKLGEASLQISAARASVSGLEANVARAKYDLDQATIRSPVSGVVLERLVEQGQTVVASFEAPALFRIAEDLSKMKIELAVDEADIGAVSEGNQVQFTVDAYPGRNFNGLVVQKRIAPSVQGNNATYPVIVSVNNSDGALIPGMLADATILVSQRTNALKLPNDYLVFTGATGERPAFSEIQGAIQGNLQLLDLTPAQAHELQSLLRDQLPENEKQDNVPPELQKFFGASAAQIVVLDDPSGNPEIAIMKDRLRRLHAKFGRFRAALSPHQKALWDGFLADLVNSRYDNVLMRRGESAIQKRILVGVTDDAFTQVLSGLTTQDEVVLPALGEQ